MPSLIKSAGWNPLTCLKLIALRICLYNYRWLYRTSKTEQDKDQVVQAWLGGISARDPEATEPALGVLPWFASDSDSFTHKTFCDAFLSNFRLEWHHCWDYYGWHWPSSRPPSHYFSEQPYTLDPKICSFSAPEAQGCTNTVSDSKLEKSENKKRSQRDQWTYLRERSRLVLLPYLEAAVERYEKAQTSGKYELHWGTTKVTDMHHPFRIETRRLIARSANTITFTNAEGKRRDLLAVIVAKEKKGDGGDAYNPCLAYMGIVHRNRKNRGEKNCVVYGIATDGYYFQILKIDNKSNLLKTEVYRWDDDFGFFLEYLHDILAEVPLQCEE